MRLKQAFEPSVVVSHSYREEDNLLDLRTLTVAGNDPAQTDEVKLDQVVAFAELYHAAVRHRTPSGQRRIHRRMPATGESVEETAEALFKPSLVADWEFADRLLGLTIEPGGFEIP